MCLFLCQEQPILQAHFLLQQPVQYQNNTGGSSGGKRQTIIERKALTYMRIFRVNLVFLKITLVRWLCWQEHLGLDSIKLNTAMTRPCWTWLKVRCWKNHLLRGSGFESATANGNISMLKKKYFWYKTPNKTEKRSHAKNNTTSPCPKTLIPSLDVLQWGVPCASHCDMASPGTIVRKVENEKMLGHAQSRLTFKGYFIAWYKTEIIIFFKTTPEKK